jgi:hypothetical protein
MPKNEKQAFYAKLTKHVKEQETPTNIGNNIERSAPPIETSTRVEKPRILS